MSQNATVNAGDIARLVDVGRAAVSNWRRRHDDFPRPVGGTASSPLFSLSEVEDWLRRNGKPFEVSLGERTWQRLRAAGDDLALGRLVAEAGAELLGRRSAGLPEPGRPGSDRAGSDRAGSGRTGAGSGALDPGTRRLLRQLATEHGARAAFEFLCARYQEAHSRRLSVTAPDVADLMAALVIRPGDTVFDPACGLGALPLAPAAGRVLGQERSDTAARIAAARLLLRGLPAEVVAGDSLRHDGFPDRLADAAVCDPPFNERSWGYPELTGDPRWTYGLPPRGEPELAWVQHCLAHVRPGGLVAVLMPAAAANRRPGKRIRGNLLRSGALRAVVTLPDGRPDLWLLRRPEPGDRPAAHVLLLMARTLAEVAPAWHAHLLDPAPRPGSVPVIELLDDDVDLSPALRASGAAGDVAAEFHATLARFRALSPRLPDLATPPELATLAGRPEPASTTIGELAKDGLVAIRHAQGRLPLGAGDLPVLLAEDVAAGTPPSGRTAPDPGLLLLRPGDVAATAAGAARVVEDGGAALGPNLTRYRVDPDRLDPDFLAGFLRAATARPHTGSSRIDARRAPLPRLPLAEQRAYGAAFRQLTLVQDTMREASTLAETLVRLGFEGLMDGRLRPGA